MTPEETFEEKRRRAELWQALDIGPFWILREAEDPLSPAQKLKHELPAAAPSHKPEVKRPSAPPPRFAPGPSVAPSAARPAASPAAAPAGHTEAELAWVRTAGWEDLRERVLQCQACPLCRTRRSVVFSEGAPGPKLVIVGEAPGAEEDLQGVPFVGKAGQLLTAMLDVLGLERGGRDVVILNVLKCRPPGNRNPEMSEMAVCRVWLDRQLELLKPEALLLMGRFALMTVLRTEDGRIAAHRGRVFEAELPDGRRVPAVVSYHPSYLLRSPLEKAKSWEDLVRLRRVMREKGVFPEKTPSSEGEG